MCFRKNICHQEKNSSEYKYRYVYLLINILIFPHYSLSHHILSHTYIHLQLFFSLPLTTLFLPQHASPNALHPSHLSLTTIYPPLITNLSYILLPLKISLSLPLSLTLSSFHFSLLYSILSYTHHTY